MFYAAEWKAIFMPFITGMCVSVQMSCLILSFDGLTKKKVDKNFTLTVSDCAANVAKDSLWSALFKFPLRGSALNDLSDRKAKARQPSRFTNCLLVDEQINQRGR